MKDLDEKQYERVARRLDGEDISLSAQEQALVDELGRLEVQVGTNLDMPLPAGVAFRLGGQLERALQHGRGVRLLFRPASLLAMAAAVLLAVGVAVWTLVPGHTPVATNPSPPTPPTLPTELDPDVARALLTSGEDTSLDWMEDEVGRMEVKAVAESVSADAMMEEEETDRLGRELNEMLDEDSKPFLPEI